MTGWLRRRFRKAGVNEPSAPLPAVPRKPEELQRAQAEHDALRVRVEALKLARDILAQQRRNRST